MPPLFDMMANAQNGQAHGHCWRGSSAFRSSRRQLAVEALTAGLQPGPEAQCFRPLRDRRLHDRDGQRPARQIFRGRRRGLFARRAWRKATAFSAICSAPRTCRARSRPGRAGDRHRPEVLKQMLPVDGLDDHGRAVQAVHKPDAGRQAASAAATIRSARSSSR